MGHRHGGTRHENTGDMRWEPAETDIDPICGKIVNTASGVIESDVPIVVQHTKLDSRQEGLSLLRTIAFASP